MTARVDYGVRVLLELAARADEADPRMTRDDLASAQDLPPRYLEAVLSQLRQAGLVTGQRGASGGYVLGRDARSITVADVARAVDGPLALVQGQRPEDVTYEGASRHLHELWIGLRAAMRGVMEGVTIADVLAGQLPAQVRDLVEDPDSWAPR